MLLKRGSAIEVISFEGNERALISTDMITKGSLRASRALSGLLPYRPGHFDINYNNRVISSIGRKE